MKTCVSQFPRLLLCVALLAVMATTGNSQKPLAGTSDAPKPVQPALAPTRFRIGEKLSYNVSFGKFANAAYAEMSVVSRGTLGGLDAIELHSKIKTLELVNAAFFQWDETRTIFVSPDTGLPLFVTKRLHNGITPQETSVNYLKGVAASFDLLSLIYKVRESEGSGTFSLFENEKMYSMTFSTLKKGERVTTEAGQFDTIVSTVQGDYLDAHGIKEIRINLSADDNHIPVLFRVKLPRGDLRASLMAVQFPNPVAVVAPTATPIRAPSATPKPKPSPTPYVDNQPLAPELGFDLGESLEYSISVKGSPVAGITLEARERRQFQNRDSLLLAATVTRVDAGWKTFVPGDYISAHVDPETLAPQHVASGFSGELNWLNQTLMFDSRTGTVAVNGAAPVDAPIGTHTLLSLIYAMRSFNLKPSKDPSNPVNDTRVAVFWETQPYIFTLRPSISETIVINGEKVEAQPITVTTGNSGLDKQTVRVWLSAADRVPLRFALGPYQADLVGNTKKPL